MKKLVLTERQRRFVDAYLANGGRPKAAAITAGYSPRTAHAKGSGVLALPHVKEAIREKAVNKLAGAAVQATKTLVELSTSAENEGVRLRAAEAILDRAGVLKVLAPQEHVVTHREDPRTTAELRATVERLTRELGLVTGPAIGSSSTVTIEAEENKDLP